MISDGVDMEATGRMVACARDDASRSWPPGTDVAAIAAAVADARSAMALVVADARAFRTDCEAELASIRREGLVGRPIGRASMERTAPAADGGRH